MWLASTAAAGDAAWAHAQTRLFDPSETRRLARFARRARHAQFVAAHVAVRRLVAAQFAVPAAAIDIGVQPDGRPLLRGGALGISLSHSADRVAVAAARSAVGVDIERLRPGRGVDVVEPWAVAEARWKTGNAHAPAWVTRSDGFMLAVAGCAEPPSVYWCDLLDTTGAARAMPLDWRRTTGAAQ